MDPKTGSTSRAIQNSLHKQKVENYLVWLKRWFVDNGEACMHDLDVAKDLILDALESLGYL